MRKDVASLGLILDDSYAATYADGGNEAKAQELDGTRISDVALAEASAGDLKVRVFGDTAVVTGRVIFRGRGGDRGICGEQLFTDVFVRRGRRWRAVVSDFSPIEPDKP